MPQGEETERITCYLEKAKLAKLDRLAKLAGMTRSEFLRNLAESALEADGPVIELGIRFGRLVHAWKLRRVGKKAKFA